MPHLRARIVFNKAVLADFKAGKIHQSQHVLRQKMLQNTADIFQVAQCFPDDLIMGVDYILILFFPIHVVILTVFMDVVKG